MTVKSNYDPKKVFVVGHKNRDGVFIANKNSANRYCTYLSYEQALKYANKIGPDGLVIRQFVAGADVIL